MYSFFLNLDNEKHKLYHVEAEDAIAISVVNENEEAGRLALKNPVKQDRGFKVLKLNKSNFKQWQDFASDAKPEHVIKQLSFHIDHIGHKATKEDLLYEILIKAVAEAEPM